MNRSHNEKRMICSASLVRTALGRAPLSFRPFFNSSCRLPLWRNFCPQNALTMDAFHGTRRATSPSSFRFSSCSFVLSSSSACFQTAEIEKEMRNKNRNVSSTEPAARNVDRVESQKGDDERQEVPHQSRLPSHSDVGEASQEKEKKGQIREKTERERSSFSAPPTVLHHATLPPPTRLEVEKWVLAESVAKEHPPSKNTMEREVKERSTPCLVMRTASVHGLDREWAATGETEELAEKVRSVDDQSVTHRSCTTCVPPSSPLLSSFSSPVREHGGKTNENSVPPSWKEVDLRLSCALFGLPGNGGPLPSPPSFSFSSLSPPESTFGSSFRSEAAKKWMLQHLPLFADTPEVAEELFFKHTWEMMAHAQEEEKEGHGHADTVDGKGISLQERKKKMKHRDDLSPLRSSAIPPPSTMHLVPPASSSNGDGEDGSPHGSFASASTSTPPHVPYYVEVVGRPKIVRYLLSSFLHQPQYWRDAAEELLFTALTQQLETMDQKKEKSTERPAGRIEKEDAPMAADSNDAPDRPEDDIATKEAHTKELEHIMAAVREYLYHTSPSDLVFYSPDVSKRLFDLCQSPQDVAVQSGKVGPLQTPYGVRGVSSKETMRNRMATSSSPSSSSSFAGSDSTAWNWTVWDAFLVAHCDSAALLPSPHLPPFSHGDVVHQIRRGDIRSPPRHHSTDEPVLRPEWSGGEGEKEERRSEADVSWTSLVAGSCAKPDAVGESDAWPLGKGKEGVESSASPSGSLHPSAGDPTIFFGRASLHGKDAYGYRLPPSSPSLSSSSASFSPSEVSLPSADTVSWEHMNEMEQYAHLSRVFGFTSAKLATGCNVQVHDGVFAVTYGFEELDYTKKKKEENETAVHDSAATHLPNGTTPEKEEEDGPPLEAAPSAGAAPSSSLSLPEGVRDGGGWATAAHATGDSVGMSPSDGPRRPPSTASSGLAVVVPPLHTDATALHGAPNDVLGTELWTEGAASPTRHDPYALDRFYCGLIEGGGETRMGKGFAPLPPQAEEGVSRLWREEEDVTRTPQGSASPEDPRTSNAFPHRVVSSLRATTTQEEREEDATAPLQHDGLPHTATPTRGVEGGEMASERVRSVFSRYDRETRLSPLRRARRGGASRTGGGGGSGVGGAFSLRSLPPPPTGWFRERGHFINAQTGVQEDVHLSLLWQLFCEEDTAELLSTWMATRLRWWPQGRRRVLAALLCQAALLLLFASRPEVMALTAPIVTFQQTWYWHYTIDAIARRGLHTGGASCGGAHLTVRPEEDATASFFFSPASPSPSRGGFPPRLPLALWATNPYAEAAVQGWWSTSYTLFGTTPFPMPTDASSMAVRPGLTEKDRHTYTTYIPSPALLPPPCSEAATYRATATSATTVGLDTARSRTLLEGSTTAGTKQDEKEKKKKMVEEEKEEEDAAPPFAGLPPPFQEGDTGAVFLLDIHTAASEGGPVGSSGVSGPPSPMEEEEDPPNGETDAAMRAASTPPATRHGGDDPLVASILLRLPYASGGSAGTTDIAVPSFRVAAHRIWASDSPSPLASWCTTGFSQANLPSFATTVPPAFHFPTEDGPVGGPPCQEEGAAQRGGVGKATAVVLSPAMRDKLWTAWNASNGPCTTVGKERNGASDTAADMASVLTASMRQEDEKRDEASSGRSTILPSSGVSTAATSAPTPAPKRRGRPPLPRPSLSPPPSLPAHTKEVEEEDPPSSSSSSRSLETAPRVARVAVEPPPSAVPKRGRGRPRLGAALSPTSSASSESSFAQALSTSSWPAFSIHRIAEDDDSDSRGVSLPEEMDDSSVLPSLPSPRRGRPKGAKNKKKIEKPLAPSTARNGKRMRRKRRKKKKKKG